MRLLLLFIISLSVFSEYKVSEFDKYCAAGCRFESKEICESWLSKAHPSKSKSLCQDNTAEAQAELEALALKAAQKLQAEGVKNIDFNSLTPTQQNKLIKFLIYEALGE